MYRGPASGADKDVDGYTLANNQLSPVADSVKKAGPEEYLHEEEILLNIGQQKIELIGVADNCEVSDALRSIEISEDQPTEVTFNVRCTTTLAGRILLVSDYEGTSELYVAEPGTIPGADLSGLHKLADNTAEKITPAASSDGSVYAWGRSRQGLAITKDGGTTIIPFTDSSGDAEPAFSPENSQIAFTSKRTGDKEIFVKLMVPSPLKT